MSVLVVSALYRIQSKRPIEEYLKRASYLIHNTSCNFLIFTTPDVEFLIPRRAGVKTCILPIEDFYSNKFATPEEYESMAKWYSADTAKTHVSPELLKIYAEKHMFVNRAIDKFPEYSYYVWNDIGTIWGDCVLKYLPSYPSISKINSLKLGDKICFSVRDVVNLEEYTSGIPADRARMDPPIAGSIILGNKLAWQKFALNYRASLKQLQCAGKYWGCDEHVYFHMLSKNPDDTTGVVVKGVYLPVPEGYAITWNMFTFILSDIHLPKPIMFEPIVSTNGYPHIKNAFWGNEASRIDVTDVLRNKRDNSQIFLSYKYFQEDPVPGVIKHILIEYIDGRTQLVEEYTPFYLFKPIHDIWHFVDKVVYINMEKEVSRRKHMETVLKSFGDKVIRFNAIEHKRGTVGCSMSHIEVLKMALKEGWKNVLVLEDDVTWNKIEIGYEQFEELTRNPYDVIMLGGMDAKYDPKTFKLGAAGLTSSYFVNKSYIPKLLSNFQEGCRRLELCLLPYMKSPYVIDRYWKSLQASDNWYIIIPNLMYQLDGYSSIEHKVNKFAVWCDL